MFVEAEEKPGLARGRRGSCGIKSALEIALHGMPKNNVS